ncbi:MAG: hypothetical protein OXU73_00670 [Candidatus Campbellbacteria bacterium]|nr:hypothetical protein [Candidatus Campbellbacteria bacterium]
MNTETIRILIKELAYFVVITLVVYYFLSVVVSPPVEEVAEGETTTTQAVSDADELLVLINSIGDIKIDTEFITSFSSQSREDFSIPITPSTQGKENPFR